MSENTKIKRAAVLPRWMKAQMPKGENYSKVRNLISEHKLHTICTSGNCPNKGECWNAGTASFMIMGDKCTRNCKFCHVTNLIPDPLDWEEPARLAQTIKTLQLKHCVITSVDRDDLPDHGASFWKATIEEIKKVNPLITIEALIPDFMGKEKLIQQVIDAKPNVISHNVETVSRITPLVRSRANYKRSLKVLEYISKSGLVAKSGIMLGLGEAKEEVIACLQDIKDVGTHVITIGQYLQPSTELIKVSRYITPEEFKEYEQIGLEMGFKFVESSPLVRSSYHAHKHVNAV